jgi:hypothetical protein
MPDVDAGIDHVTPPDPGTLTPEQACESYLDSYCRVSAKCTPYLSKWLDGTLEECKSRNQFGCVARLRAQGTTEPPAAEAACGRALENLSCDDYVWNTAWPAACDVPPGTLPDGTACLASSQCASLNCKKASPMRGSRLCGVCAPLSKTGGPCETLFDCEGFGNCVQGTCSPLVPLGGTCDVDRACDGYLTCVGLSATSAGTCSKPLGLGAPCDPDYDACDNFITGLWCSQTTRTCAPLPLAGPGQSCLAPDNTVLNCASALRCETNPQGQMTCVSGTPEGAPCTQPYECSASHKCFNGTCVPLDPNLCR